MNGYEPGAVEYSTKLAFNSNLPNLIVLNVAFYMHLIRQFDSARRLNQALATFFPNVKSKIAGTEYYNSGLLNCLLNMPVASIADVLSARHAIFHNGLRDEQKVCCEGG